MLFDTHTHYDDPRYDKDRHEVIMNAHKAGVDLLLNASSDIESGTYGINIAKKYSFMYAAIGVHPHVADSFNEESEQKIRTLALDTKVIAIGETGLDYHYDNSPRNRQKDCFARQINIAKELKLPLIVHSRDATADTLDIIRAEKAWEAGGVIHCYGGSYETAVILADMGFFFSFGGVLTFKKAERPREVARRLPFDRILIETDCPYITPEPFRGKRNDSSLIVYIAEALAAIKNVTPEEAGEITKANGMRLFGIKQKYNAPI